MSKRYLIVGPSWVGDMVMAQSLFKTIYTTEDISIDVIAPQWSLPMLERMPEVNRGIALPVGHGELAFNTRRKIGHSLRANHYDHAIVLPRSMKSALVPFFAKATIRTGYRGEMRYGLINDMRQLDKSVLTQTVHRYVALGYPTDTLLPPPIPEPSLTIDRANQKQVLEELGLDTIKPVIGFMPGAEYGPAKQWPAQHYAELAKMLDANGYQIWILGSQKDKQIAGEIDGLSGGVTTILCGKTALVDVVDLMAVCSTVVSNDSGLMHVAAATGTPVVGIYGSSTPDYTPPLTQKAEILYLRLGCSPCFKRQCPLKHSNCLNNIDPQNAYDAILRLGTGVKSQ